MHCRFISVGLLFIVLIVDSVFGQQYGRGRQRVYPDRSEFPMWENEDGFARDVFTFARIKYEPHYFRGWDAVSYTHLTLPTSDLV